MTLKEKLKWTGAIENRLESVNHAQREIALGNTPKVTFYWFVGKTHNYSVECYVEGDIGKSREAAKFVVQAALEYFYGSWRKTLVSPDGTTGHDAWKPFCLLYEELMRSLPWACALGEWKAVSQLAEYPPEDKLPEASKAKGEAAWGWALVSFLRGDPRKRVDEFMKKAEADKAKRLKLLCPVLRALMDRDEKAFFETLLAYLAYYRKSEFKLDLDKLLALEGTTLYHLGRKQGFKVPLPENVADHVIRFD